MKKITYKVEIDPAILGENINILTLEGYVKDRINEEATRYCEDTGQLFRVTSTTYDTTKKLTWFVDVLYFSVDVSIVNQVVLSSEFITRKANELT